MAVANCLSGRSIMLNCSSSFVLGGWASKYFIANQFRVLINARQFATARLNHTSVELLI